eukprot:TRINITY_DN24849_c0_g1_i1.p2 TRINITY_DN24849_c0_g1~~TRINITY_DN24849_c0_g1_i1.p2  ORF type:complete len:154 (+),score=21.92 TRINITY_DN24849_c0_g1_i1:145-606(+)
MLQVCKNEALANVCKDAVGVRLLELGWCTRNYDTMACQAALLAGFAFEQITQAMPQGTGPKLEVLYLSLTVGALGFNLCVCTACAFCCIFGQALALRGPDGARSVNAAVDGLQERQVFGGMSAQWSPYERLQDLDEEICRPMVSLREPGPCAA